MGTLPNLPTSSPQPCICDSAVCPVIPLAREEAATTTTTCLRYLVHDDTANTATDTQTVLYMHNCRFWTKSETLATARLCSSRGHSLSSEFRGPRMSVHTAHAHTPAVMTITIMCMLGGCTHVAACPSQQAAGLLTGNTQAIYAAIDSSGGATQPAQEGG